MVDLIALTPCKDMLPATVGGVTMTEADPTAMWSVAPYRGKDKAVGAALGLNLPKPGRRVRSDGISVAWAGIGLFHVQADALPDLSELAAVTDQSDGWATVAISGPDVVAVLARLVPMDLRQSVFKTDHTARTFVGHMTASVTRTGANAFEVRVMRSMAATLVHDLIQAATMVAGRP